MKLSSVIAASLALAFAAQFARADVGPPIAFRLPPGILQPADRGREYAGRIEIQIGADGVLNGVTLSGLGWTIKSIELIGARHVKAGEIIPVAFVAISDNPAEALQIAATFDDVQASARFDLSPQRFERLKHKLPLRRLDAPAAAIPPSPAPAPRGGAIHLHCLGRFVYTRPDNVIIGGDTVKFRIMDDDSPAPDEIMYEGYTTRNGDFDVQFDWDDCDAIGCDDPDIYIEFETANNIVTTKDSNGTNYSWSGEDNTLVDFTGTFVNFGLLTPSNNQDAAVHINNSIVHTHRYIQDAAGIDVPHVDAMWADDSRGGTGAWYTPGLALIHVSTDEQWIEGTHHHEYGHHFMATQAINTTPNYCNGVCDSSPTNCGHCVWCAENATDAFNEGFPDWLGSAVNRVYPIEYGVTAFSINDGRYTLEDVQTCSGGTPDNAQNTEGFVGALLRDIEDGTQDDSTGSGDCAQDVLALGPAPILSTVALDDPTTLAAFIADFRTRYPQYDQDLDSTATNVSATYAFSPPNPIVTSQSLGCRTNRVGDNLTLNVTGNGALLHYQWRRNGANIFDTGARTGTGTRDLFFHPLTTDDSGSYDCVVSTCDNSRTTNSQPVTLRVFAGSPGPAVAWGANPSGQCGNGTQNNPSPPTAVSGLADAVSVEGNAFQLTALRPDGTVWCAGYNGYGGIGDFDPSHLFALSPQQVPGLSDVTRIRSGGATNYAIRRDGSLWAWGYNAYGQVADGSSGNSRSAPSVAQNLNCVVDVGSSFYHVVAVQSDGTVWTWGLGNSGQLGDGPANTFRILPAQVPGLTGVTAIATSDAHVLALKFDGTVWAWGAAASGQLGIGPNPPAFQYTPVQVQGLSNVVAVATAPDTARSYAITSNGRVWVWGQNAFGALGTGNISGETLYTPHQLVSLTNVQTIRAASFAMFAINGDGAVWASGSNDQGLLGPTVPSGTYWYSPQPLLFLGAPMGLSASSYTVWAQAGIVPLPHDGNVNGDGAANGSDLQPFVAAVLANAPATGNLARADFNSNGILDAADVSGMMNILLNP